MNHSRLKASVAALAVAALIGLSACGGSDGLSKADEEALQMEAAAAEEAKRQAEEAKRQAEEAQRQAEEAKRQAEEAQRQAEEEARQAELERVAAEARAEEARRQRQEAEQAEREAEQQRQAAEEQRQREEQARQAAEAEAEEARRRLTEAEQAELRARANSFGTVLDLGDGGTAEQGPVTVSWPRGSNLTFRPSGTLTPGSAAPSVPGGWRSAGFTGQTGTATALTNETAYLYTNIQAPGTRAFWKVHGLTVTMDGAGLAPLARGSSASPDADTDTGATGHQYSELTVSGSLNGASGKFTCSTCSGTVGDESDGIAQDVTFSQGVPTFIAPGSWTFTPSNIANGYRADTDDAYLYFGVWSSIPDSISGTTYNFRYIAGGGAESGSDLGNFDALTGSATFRGGAVGRYVTQGQVGGQNAKIGTFTATATFNADFAAADAAGTLSGSITDFQEGGSPLAGWRVTLGSATDVGVASTITAAAATGSTVANIGGLPVGGSWGATFHGSDNEGVSELTDPTMYPATRYPPVDLAGVTGWFDATGTSASLAGAFAATPSN